MLLEKIEYTTDYGKIYICLKDLMDKNNISISAMSNLTGVKYDIVKKYYCGFCYQYDGDILAKFCYILNCDISDVLKYSKTKIIINQG